MYAPRKNFEFLQYAFSCEFEPRKNFEKMHIREFGRIFGAKICLKNRISR